MIISYRRRFVFLHNPKVAGSSIRNELNRFRDTAEFFNTDPDPASPTHRLDRAHIGIDEFARYYPDLWATVRDFPFFVLYRDPAPRFYSAVNEYSRIYGDTDIRFARLDVRRDFLLRTIDMLEARGTAENVMDVLELTHFRPQWIFLSAPHADPEGTLDIRAYDLADFPRFASALSAQVDENVQFNKENASEQFAFSGPLADILSANRIKKTLRWLPGTMLAMKLLRDRAEESAGRRKLRPADRYGLSPSQLDMADAFIARFYARDRAFLNTLKRNGAATREAVD